MRLFTMPVMKQGITKSANLTSQSRVGFFINVCFFARFRVIIPSRRPRSLQTCEMFCHAFFLLHSFKMSKIAPATERFSSGRL